MLRTSWLAWLWPLLIILIAISAGLVTFVFPGTVIRPAVLMLFLIVCPGMAVVYFFRLTEAAVEWMLIIALSLAIDAFVAGGLLYAGRWSPPNILIILIGLCIISAIMRLLVMLPVFAALAGKLTHVRRS